MSADRFESAVETTRIEIQRDILRGASLTALDVGAAEGLQPHWHAYVGTAEMYLVEPHPEGARRLREVHKGTRFGHMFHVLEVGLAGTGGRRTLHVTNTPTGSSLLPVDIRSEFVDPGSPYFFPLSEIEIDVKPISAVLDEISLASVDLIKLDVQGAELEILRGLDSSRREALILLEAEVNISGGITSNLSCYQGAPTWAELDSFCLSAGLRLLDISVARAYRARNGDAEYYQRNIFNVYANSPGISAHVWEADVVYVRDYRKLIEARDEAGLRRLLVALGGYRFFSEAAFIVEQAEIAGIFTAQQSALLSDSLARWHRSGVRKPWHGRGAMWTALRTLLRKLRCSQLRRWKQYMWFEYPNG